MYYALSQVDLHRAFIAIADIDPLYLALAIVAQFVSTSISGMRSNFYHRGYEIQMPLRTSLLLYWFGNFYNMVLPGGVGGDVLKALKIAKAYAAKKSLALRIQLYERVNGFYPLVILAFIFIIFSNLASYEDFKYLAAVLLVATTPLYLWGVRYVLRDKVVLAMEAAVRYSLATQILHVASGYCLCLAFAQFLPQDLFIEFIALYLVSTIATIIPITAGGIGMKEFCFITIMPQVALNQWLDVGLSYAFISYVIALVVGLSGGLIWGIYGHTADR